MAKPTTRVELVDYCKRKLGAPVLEINVDDDLLFTYQWPGNVRELRNLVERISILSQNENFSYWGWKSC